MNNLNWYLNLYYKFRDYPIAELNSSFKPNQLKTLYSSMIRKLFLLFQLDNRKQGQIETLISKNNYDLMINKRVENNLAQQQQNQPLPNPLIQSHVVINIDDKKENAASNQSIQSYVSRQQRKSDISQGQKSRWQVDLSPTQKNMDVFYELMIKMIRVSLRRLMIQTFTLDKYGKNVSKQAIKQIFNSHSQFELIRKTYFAENDGKNAEANDEVIEVISYPATIEEIKFQFLKYCISCKVYNNPQEHSQTLSSQSLSSSFNSNTSIPSLILDKNIKKQDNSPKLPSISDDDIESLILKVSADETSIFNKIIELYQSQVKNSDSNKGQMSGIKHIAQSIIELVGQNEANNNSNLLKGIYNSPQTNLLQNSSNGNSNGNISNSNILLATWFDLILFKETPHMLLDIIEEMVRLQKKQNLYGDVTPPTERPQKNEFYYKISSFLHLLILNSTKNIFVQSLLKINYLLVLSKDVIGQGKNPKKSFREIYFKNYEEKINGKTKVYDNIQLTYDVKLKKYLWKEEAMDILLSKWKIIANVITEVCVKNNSAFFAMIFQKCVALLDKQLSIQVELIEKLMLIAENIENEHNLNPAQNQKCQHICRVLYGIVREIIGYGEGIDTRQEDQEKYLNISNYINTKTQADRYKQASFANREQSAQELEKWNEIISQNLYVYTQYKNNLEIVTKLFKNNNIYIALWFNKFHSETKEVVKKVEKSKIQKIFKKFIIQIPILWDYMTSDTVKTKPSKFKRTERGKIKNRISSIKADKTLSIIEKKTIVLNYMIKAQLELYSHYMLVKNFNNQKNFASFLEKQMGEQKQVRSRPEIFDHKIIKNLTLFPVEDQPKLAQNNVSHFARKHQKQLTHNVIDTHSNLEIQGIKTLKNIEKNKNNNELDDLFNAIQHFDKPMDLELDLKQNWKQKFGQNEIEYLSELNDYIRYLNEINYLYQFWSWTESSKGVKKDDLGNRLERKKQIDLLNGYEYKIDLDEIDRSFEELKKNEEFVAQVLVTTGGCEQLLKKEKLSEMHKRIKIHNKELYMMLEAIIEGQNYFKLIAANLIGRDQNSKFKQILQEIINHYKKNNRQKSSIRLFDKMKQSMMYDQQMTKKQSKLVKFQSEDLSIGIGYNDGRKNIKKSGGRLAHFQFAPEYYKIQSKIFRLDCLMASFQIGNNIFRNIKHSHILSKERVQRLVIIGGPYYDKLESFLNINHKFESSDINIGEEMLQKAKTHYQRKLLLLIITIINMNYNIQDRVKKYSGKSNGQAKRIEFTNIPEEDLKNYNGVLQKYSDLLKKFLYWCIKENIKRVEERQNFQKMNVQNQRKEQKQFNICKFLEETLQLSQKNDDYNEEIMLLKLQTQIEKQTNKKFSLQFKSSFEVESTSLDIYKSQQEKVQYLRKKLAYLLLRQMYFILNYENEFLSCKSVNSKKNYMIYQQRIFKFYQQIIHLDYQQFIEKKEEEIKKRSVHLKNYEFKYQKPPAISNLEISINQIVCCLYNQLLTTYTSKIEHRMFTQKAKTTQSLKENISHIYKEYCSSQYLKEIKDQKEIKLHKEKKGVKETKKTHKVSVSSAFSQIFNSNNSAENEDSFCQQGNIGTQQPVYKTVLVYTIQKFDLSQSLKVYLKILQEKYNQYVYQSFKSVSSRYSFASTMQEPLSERQIMMIKNNQKSLITLLKAQQLQHIHNVKCQLIRKNLLSNIERLYINLDVRHKVFESFQDRILNYEMQKAKIYHQYMDYIRGLKLDVYSHMAGQNPLPYIKIIHGVKLYRLKIKKDELQKRVSRQFQKNLKKWNCGIQQKLQEYNLWLVFQQRNWRQKQQKLLNDKKNLFEIYHIVRKQYQRQNKSMKIRETNSSKKIIENFDSIDMNAIPKKVQMKMYSPVYSVALFKKSVTFKQKNVRNTHVTKYDAKSQLAKFSNDQSTKQNTRYQKLTIGSKSQIGFRGFSIKYDTTGLASSQPKKEEKTRNTEFIHFSVSKSHSSTIHMKATKRYQSAQKQRIKIEN